MNATLHFVLLPTQLALAVIRARLSLASLAKISLDVGKT